MTLSRLRSVYIVVGSLEYPVLFIIDPLYEISKAARALTSFIPYSPKFSKAPRKYTPFPSTYPPDPRLPRSGQLTTGTGRFVESLYKVGRNFFHRIVSNYNTRAFPLSVVFSNNI